MEISAKSFTDIGQFRQVVKQVRENHDYLGKDENGETKYSHLTPYPVLKFRGTVKLHGTNSSIVKYKDNDEIKYQFQSRERVLNLIERDGDNYNFMEEMLKTDYKKLFDGIEFKDYVAIYGEWCGMGIMKGVVISKVPRMFVIFAIKIDDVYQDLKNFELLKIEEQNIYNILQFPYYEIDIDFNKPEMAQNKLIEFTTAVEQECPVGKSFGVSGVGEGVVWECFYKMHRYIMKVKGEKHSVTKVKKLAAVNTEEVENINAFIDYAVTENRLLQGIDKMKEMGIPLDPKSTADYLRWVYNDVIKEESDTMTENNIDPKKIGSYISAKARMFWLNYLNSNFQ